MKKLLFVFAAIFSLSKLIAKEGYIEVNGSVGKPELRFDINNPNGCLFGSYGFVGGFKTKIVRFGVGFSHNISVVNSEYVSYDHLWNINAEGKLSNKYSVIIPSVDVTSNFGLEKIYPLVGVRFGIPIYNKITSKSPNFFSEQKREQLKQSDSFIKWGQSIALRGGLGYNIKDIISLEASVLYQTFLNGYFFKKEEGVKNPFQIGSQISILVPIGRKTSEK